MFALLAHTSLLSLAPIVVAWGLNLPWWVFVLMAFTLIGPTLACALLGIGVLVWCAESVQEHSDLGLTRPIAITALVLGLVAAGLFLREHPAVTARLMASISNPWALDLPSPWVVLLTIVVLSWLIVTVRARSSASRLHAVIPALVTSGYVGFVLPRLMRLPGFNELILIAVLMVALPPLFSPKLAMLLGVLIAVAIGLLVLLSMLAVS